MLYENKNPMISGVLQAIGGAQLDEGAIVARFAARVDALGPLSQVSKALQVHLLEEVKTIAQHLDGSTEAGLASGYDRRVLGVTESPEKWQFDHFDADMMAAMGSQIAAEDTVLLGRVTYQGWAAYWPTSDDELYGSHINNTPKYVVSTTLDKVEWGKWDNATLIKGNLAEEIARLKQQPGKNIGVAGSPTLVRSLLQQDLLDELTLLLHPVVVGRGKRLFKEGSDLKRLQLTYSKATSTGVMILTYQPGHEV